MSPVNHWIDGKAMVDEPERTGAVHDPATGDRTTAVAYADGATVDRAVASAVRASAAWRDTSLAARSRILFSFRHLVSTHREELAELIVAEHGKVYEDALGEVQRGLEVVEFACGIPHLLKGAYSENVSTEVDSYDLRQPLGVVAGITPFNFPVMVPMWMHPLAIASGNTFVHKPSEKVPSVANRVAELWAEAGLPEGVLNVVHGDRVAVDRLLEHPDVQAVSFVGSTPVARHVYETGTAHGKRVQALGGAKNHMLVLPDADLDGAADAAVSAACGSAGERCMAISVIVAVGPIADELVRAIADRMRQLRVGPGSDAASEMGPLVTRDHRDRVAGYVERGSAEGATLVVDGRGARVDGYDDGFWFGPTLLDNVESHMSVYTDEIFGPVLAVVRVDDLDAAITLVNGNRYGNGTAIFTRDGAAARRFQHEVDVGMVGVNVPIPVPMAYHSFGGWKESLFGGTKVHGSEGVSFYTRTKVVTARWPSTERGVDLRMPTNG